MDLANFVGQRLDGKYKIERELGRGGMGAVYLATHIGTERPVALKVIVPQFMQRAEFVERFRREARAAGRLRHPNVVDVTDFGFAETAEGRVAYLVMEYLDGCTLGEILEEEKKLPLVWTLDILEQVCSAVDEAHRQGIIHRDLKPDNIWLEPNQRGGYTVKVLDFGIAKLEPAPMAGITAGGELPPPRKARPTQQIELNSTGADDADSATVAENKSTVAGERQTIAENSRPRTFFAEAGTLIQPAAELSPESGTAIISAGARDKGTAIMSPDEAVDDRGTAIRPPAENFSEKGTAVMTPGEHVSEKGTALMSADEYVSEKSTALMSSGEAISERGTAIMAADEDAEPGTAILPPEPTAKNNKATKLMSAQIETAPAPVAKNSSELTRVGAVLGTPLYMSPEQCRGEHLDARSDIYSLGIIAYQMLSGKTPFAGDFMDVMSAHKETIPPPLEEKKLRPKIKRVIADALAKNPDQRPPTAQAFASRLRSHSEGIGALFQRSLIIYSQHLPKFLTLALIIYSPIAVTMLAQVVINFLEAGEAIGGVAAAVLKGTFGLAQMFFSFFCGYLILGTTAWTVTQILGAPLRPVALRPAFRVVRSKWKSLAFTGTLSTVLSLLGYCLIIPGLIMSVLWALVAPVIMMENARGVAALKRSKALVMRSLRTTTAAIFVMFLVPMIIGGLIGFVSTATVKSFSPPAVVQKTGDPAQDVLVEGDNVKITVNGQSVKVEEKPASETAATGEAKKADKKRDMGSRVRSAVSDALTQIILLPFTILAGSFSAVVIALLYLKTRQAGGESMQELLAQFTDDDQPERNWQKRVRQRLEQSGKLASKSEPSGAHQN